MLPAGPRLISSDSEISALYNYILNDVQSNIEEISLFYLHLLEKNIKDKKTLKVGYSYYG